DLIFRAGLGPLQAQLTPLVTKLYALGRTYDALTIEINPLALTRDGGLVAADAKLEIDENALFRHKDLHGADESDEDPLEAEAKRRKLTYVRLEGSIGVIGNGAGLVMNTLDLVEREGGHAADFLDIGGGAKADVVHSALELLAGDPRVKGILINIFGGITRGDEVAHGIIDATRDLNLKLPLVVRMTGTREEEGRQLLKEAGIPPEAGASAAARKIVELAAAGIGLIVCITEGIPLYDMVRARAFVEDAGVELIGPNCPGLVTAGQAKVGIIPNHINREGSVGIVSRSGTLTYEVIQGLSQAGVGQTTSVGIGGDPILGLSFSEVLRLFKEDPATRAVVMIGEIGGSDEEAAAEAVIGRDFSKPVIGFISGRTAPPGKRLGHAGAIISGNTGTASSKVQALKRAGAEICDTIEEVVAAAGAAVDQ